MIQSDILSALEASTIAFLVTVVLGLAPKAAQALAAVINTNKTLHQNAIMDRVTAEAVAYFKAHQDEFTAKGVSLVDYACGALQAKVPGLDRVAAEHAVQLFISTLASDLK